MKKVSAPDCNVSTEKGNDLLVLWKTNVKEIILVSFLGFYNSSIKNLLEGIYLYTILRILENKLLNQIQSNDIFILNVVTAN